MWRRVANAEARASGATSPVPAAAAPGAKRRTLVVALVVLVVLAAAIAALTLTGVLGGDGARAKSTVHKARVSAARSVAGPKTAAGASTATTTAAPASGPVDLGTDPCGVLDPASIAKATGLAVGAGHPVEAGCAWQGANSAGSAGSAQDRQILGGHEGVLVTVQPPGTKHPSVTCTTTLPGVSEPGGVCTLPGADGHYAMFQTHGNVVEITIVSGRPSTDAQLAQLAYSRSQ